MPSNKRGCRAGHKKQGDKKLLQEEQVTAKTNTAVSTNSTTVWAESARHAKPKQIIISREDFGIKLRSSNN